MRIEVVANPSAPTKEKGDLLEKLAATLLKAQSYKVKEQLRVTGCELDLLCEHSVSGKKIYVECKAHRASLPADTLTKLLGTVDLKGYCEGWLISTGPLGKDAKGTQEEWEQKPRDTRSRLSFYTPDRIVEALQNAGVVSSPPITKAICFLQTEEHIGEWTLLVSQRGYYWACTCLEHGVPVGVAVFSAKDHVQVTDPELLGALSHTDTTLSSLAFDYTNAKAGEPEEKEEIGHAVVEVEFGESWIDYRPARPEHFVGRTRIQRDVRSFLSRVKARKAETRVFAVKGDSGIGKSSLVVNLRDRLNKGKKPSNVLVFAVDLRAASSPGYVHASLLEALKQAADRGFGTRTGDDLRVTNYSDPVASESIRKFMEECEKQKQLIVLVLDQFEEFYSKVELFSVFEEAQRLMISTVAARTNLVLGFAWKTDTTVPQDHPAYHMWHQLSDHRFEFDLPPFTHADVENSVKMFEKEIKDRIRPELRKYVIENSQGYPWLLKKLCIHLYYQLQRGVSQSELADRSLDISSLFERDLNNLNDAERACVKLVANNAPMDWFEADKSASADVVRSLQEKRILVRRGSKLNLYWDIFREYVLNGSIPDIPFTHVPQSPSIAAVLKVAEQLDPVEPRTTRQISEASGLKESTVRNILHDLSVFGIASVDRDLVSLDKHVNNTSPEMILTSIRSVFRRHALTEILKKHDAPPPATQENIIQYLKRINPAAKHHSRTWITYANRMGQWLTIAGYLRQLENGWIYDDCGEVRQDTHVRLRGVRKRRRMVFAGDAPPSRAVEALDYLLTNSPQSLRRMKSLGYRNGCAVLFRLGLIEIAQTDEYRVSSAGATARSSLEAVWLAARKEPTIVKVVEYLRENPSRSDSEIGSLIEAIHERKWSDASRTRVGNGLRQWAGWILSGEHRSDIPEPPGLRSREGRQEGAQQLTFLEDSGRAR